MLLKEAGNLPVAIVRPSIGEWSNQFIYIYRSNNLIYVIVMQ